MAVDADLVAFPQTLVIFSKLQQSGRAGWKSMQTGSKVEILPVITPKMLVSQALSLQAALCDLCLFIGWHFVLSSYRNWPKERPDAWTEMQVQMGRAGRGLAGWTVTCVICILPRLTVITLFSHGSVYRRQTPFNLWSYPGIKSFTRTALMQHYSADRFWELRSGEQ